MSLSTSASIRCNFLYHSFDLLVVLLFLFLFQLFNKKTYQYFSFSFILIQNNGAQQLASEATVYIMLEDVNDEIPLFTEREQETVLEGEPIGTKVTQVNAIDKDGTFPNNQV